MGSRLRELGEEEGEGRVGKSDGAAVMRSGCTRDDTKTRHADGWSGHVHATKSGLAIQVSVLIFKIIFFAHKRRERPSQIHTRGVHPARYPK